ncbi:UDP-N-acetylmuramoyl-tripeptide--D-alanyl-D-alanine ligase [Pelotomaculum propionicicum]|uniref:UDP-N-acetylmuramoyl-tripeptide--D-alanyl-D- alanine ligase n=1 Tax=Pelotomaculum propionicicum TaxID=258475 RepID=UPI003B7B07C1
MIPVTLGDIAQATGGEIIQGDPGSIFSSVSTDTRTTAEGDLFFALRGERYDAHDFLGRAVSAGARGLVVSSTADLPQDIPVLLAGDTLAALQSLASLNRIRSGAYMVGVTGSTGKTTTKDIIASVLGTRFRTLKTTGNFNNEIGLPLTLLELDQGCEAAVVEMAMRGAGEIDSLCRIAGPDCAVITTVNETHLELLGDVSSIAAAKGEILDHIPPGGFALLNAESPFIRREAGRCRGRVVFFGLEPGADIRAENIRPGGEGSVFDAVMGDERHTYMLPVPGRHNVINALAAVGVGKEMGLTDEEIARGLAGVVLTGMRLEVIESGGIKIINDTYNASPASTMAALQTLADLAGAGRKIAVLGNMLELGPRALAGHREVGEAAAGLKLDCLVTVGDLAASIHAGAAGAGMEKAVHCGDNDSAIRVLDKLLAPGDSVLVKGSRGMKMEQIVQRLVKPRNNSEE